MNRIRLAGLLVMFVVMGATSVAGAFVWPNVPEEIERGLAADDVAERRAAARRLRELPSFMASESVLRALEDEDADVRLIASLVASELRVMGAGERVVEWLGDSDVRLRLAACELLRFSPTPHGIGPLSRALGDGNEQVRIAAVSTLGAIGEREVVPALLGHLDDSSLEVRTAVVSALGRIGDERAVVPLLGKVQDTSLEVRRMAVRVLGDLGDSRATSVLVLALRDRSDEVRGEAVDSLGKLRAVEAVSALAALVQDRSSIVVRNAAVHALGRIGTDVAIETLVAALEHDDPNDEDSPVREALEQVGSKAIPGLELALSESSHPSVIAGAVLVLGSVGSEVHVSVVVGVMQRGKVSLGIGLRALGKLGSEAALPYVLELLEAPSFAVRKEAMAAAEALIDPSRRDGRSVDPIMDRLLVQGLSMGERVSLTRLLGRTGSPRAGAILFKLAKAKDMRLRMAAISALGELGPAGQDEVLLETLSDTETSVRLAAAIALSKTGTSSTASILLHRLSQAPEQDRLALGIALSGAMGRARNDSLVKEAMGMVGSFRGEGRDALIEGLGRMATVASGRALATLAASSISVDDRRKIAEALANHPLQVELVRRLADDVDPSVQANAVWALGWVGDGSDVVRLRSLIQHRDVAVAGNAVVALGRLELLGKASDGGMCELLGDSRGYVRANALSSLLVLGRRCGERERQLLVGDDSVLVRERAARLIGGVVSSQRGTDERVLRRCVVEDRSGQVASACRRPVEVGVGHDEVLVFVVPEGGVRPVERGAFSLVLADGRIRLGVTDRRGAVFEARAPRGVLRLGVPAAGVR